MHEQEFSLYVNARVRGTAKKVQENQEHLFILIKKRLFVCFRNDSLDLNCL